MGNSTEAFYKKQMQKCIEIAKKGFRNVMPNPMVGCIIVDENGNEISRGYHEKCGSNHAERNAILDAEDFNLENSTLFVNLEPCSHFGKTPPCADLIIEKKIKKVVIGIVDPNPEVAGKGIEKLKNAGIEVVVGILEKEAQDLNKVFLKNITEKKPYVSLKTACTLDGKIATENGHSKWITGNEARQRVMQLRSEYQAIMTGSGTVLADNSKLTARCNSGVNPIRVIMDKEGKIPPHVDIFNNNCEKIIVISNVDKKFDDHIEKIEFKDFDTLMKKLYSLGIYSLLVEAGSGLNSALIAAKEVDELYQFVAPKILGGGKTFISGLEPETVDDAIQLKDLQIEMFGADALLNAKFIYSKNVKL